MAGETITITIDNQELSAQAGQTILEVARENGVSIPTLCYHPKLLPIGSCRLCVVEIEGTDKPMTACTTPIQDGIVVHTRTARLARIRTDALKLILTYHPLDCPQCDAAGACELQDLVVAFGIDQQDYQATRTHQGMREFATPLIRQWGDRCVMCLRCIRADHEIVRTRAIDLVGTGNEAQVGVVDPEACISCGECLRVCPVGALTEHVSRTKARPWQGDTIPTTCTYCSLGCQLELQVFENQVVGVTATDDAGANKGSLCQRGIFGYDFLYHPGRVTAPLMKTSTKATAKKKEASWDEALSYIAAMLNTIKMSHGPEAIGGLISPRSTNEEVYLFQQFMRDIVGTNNIDTTGRLCLEPYRLALQSVIGRDYLPHTLDDIATSDCIIIAGGDLDVNNNIIAANRVREALWKNGARLIVLHPHKGQLANEADCWIGLRPGDEAIWAQGMIHLLLKDTATLRSGVDGIAGFKELKDATKGFTPSTVAKAIGISQDLLKEAAMHLSKAQRPAFVCSPPLGQGIDGVEQVTGLVNLALLSNAFVSTGGGMHFVGPQSNMVGAVEMGAVPSLLPGYIPAEGKGLHAGEMLQAAFKGKLKALIVIGEDPFITLPRGIVEKGLQKLDFLVLQDMFFSETAEKAHVFLPALSFAEKDGTSTNCEGRVQRVRTALEPPTDIKDIGEIVSDITSFMGEELSIESMAGVFEEIAENNPLYKGMLFEMPDASRRDGIEGGLLEQAAFSPIKAEPYEGKKDYPYLLSIEGIFYNHLIGCGSQTRCQGLSQVSPGAYVMMNAEAASKLGFEERGRIVITTPSGSVEVTIKGSPGMKGDALVLYLPCDDIQAARLVAPKFDSRSGVPAYAGIPARVKKA